MMLNNNQLEIRLLALNGVEYAKVSGDGYHYQLTIVTDLFIDKSKLERQRWVYAQLKDDITTGSLHALTMKTFTKSEWEKERG